MEYRRLGRSDLEVSSIGLGCATFGREIDEPTSYAVLDRALEQGINLIDTAESYGAGRSEELVGRWLTARGARGKIVLATKVSGSLSRQRILMSAEASLRRLQSDTIDLFQLHVWDPNVPLEETLEALNILIERGKARYVGCSNYSAQQLRDALRTQEINGWVRFESVQPNYNLVVREIEAALLPLCVDERMGVITYSPLGGGFLSGKYSLGGDVPVGTRMDVVPAMQEIYFHEAGFRIVEGLRAHAEALGVPMAQLALAWVLGQPAITSVLIGARTPDHVDQALRSQAMGMSAELREKLSDL